jgi:hypothetical protein
MAYVSDDYLFPVRREPRNRWERTGVSPANRRKLDVSLGVLLVVLVVGWIYTAYEAVGRGETPGIGRQLAAGTPLAGDAPPAAVFALDALAQQLVDWDEIRGESGEVRVVFQQPGDSLALPGALPPEAGVAYVPAGSTIADSVAAAERAAGQRPSQPGIWNLLLTLGGVVRAVPSLSVVTLVPASELRSGRIGTYRIGNWPAGEGAYAPPRGFVQVTPENRNTPVSTHFVLGDFITKGQEGVWPKYVALSPRLLDKLELTLDELEAAGNPVEDVFVVSGFRTPWYNESGGNTQGRGALSRHMYGDAADIAIDNNGDGCMDDLTGDGRATVADARVIVRAAEEVERKYPHLIGGIGVYAPVPGSHCGMVHIDTRGNRARW